MLQEFFFFFNMFLKIIKLIIQLECNSINTARSTYSSLSISWMSFHSFIISRQLASASSGPSNTSSSLDLVSSKLIHGTEHIYIINFSGFEFIVFLGFLNSKLHKNKNQLLLCNNLFQLLQLSTMNTLSPVNVSL